MTNDNRPATSSKKKASPEARQYQASNLLPIYRKKSYFASTGSTITNLPIVPLSMNLMRPVILANNVSSLPRPTFRPGFTRVPRCRTMIVPPGTICPPNALNPSRCAFESRPFRDVPCPFLCAIDQLSILKYLEKSRPRSLFLLLWCRLLPRSFLRRSLFLGMSLGSLNFDFVLVLFRRGLLHLRLLLFQLRGLKALPVKSNLRDAHSAEGLPVPAQLLILLFALVMKNQNLRASALFHQFAD